MPYPRKGESKEEYISRAVQYMIKIEGMDRKAALGKAYGMWEEYKKKGKR